MKHKMSPDDIPDKGSVLSGKLASLNDKLKSSAEKVELLNDVFIGLDEAITGKTISASEMMAALDDDQ